MLFINLLPTPPSHLTPEQEVLAQLKSAIYFRRSDHQIAAFAKAIQLGLPIGKIIQVMGEVIDYFTHLAKTKLFIERALERTLSDI